MSTLTDIRQLRSRDSLTRTTGAADSKLDAIVRAIDSELTPALALTTSGSSKIVNIGNITIANTSTSTNHTIPPISNLIPTFTSGTVTAGTTGAGNITPSTGSAIALSMTASQFLRVGINIDSSGSLTLTKGTAASSLASATTPATVSGSLPIGHVVIRTDASNNVQNILSSDLYEYRGPYVNAGTAVSLATPTVAGTTTSYFPTIQSGIKSVTGANYTVTTTDGYASVYVDTTGTNRTITLPLASANIGRILRIRRTDATNASKVIIAAAGSDVIYSGVSLTATSVTCEKFNSLVVLEAIASGIWAVDEGVTFDIGTTTLDGGFTGGSAHVYRCGSIIHVTIEAPTWNSGSFTYTTTTAIVPANFRPAGSGTTATIICGTPSDGSHGHNMTWAVLANGSLKMFQNSNTSTNSDDYAILAGCYNIRF